MLDDNDDVTAAVKRPIIRRPKPPNTCAPSSKTKRLTAQLAGIMAHLENNPNDTLSQARVARIKDILAGRDNE